MATKKQIAVKLGRATHYLDELNVKYVVLVEGLDRLWHNTTDRHALDAIREFVELSDKIREQRIEDRALKLTAIPPAE